VLGGVIRPLFAPQGAVRGPRYRRERGWCVTDFNPEDVEPLLELGPLGNVTRRLGCGRGLAPRFHDVLLVR
jgi:hypothetical protein